MVAYAPPDGVLVNIGAAIRAEPLLAAGKRLLPRIQADKKELAAFGISDGNIEEIEEQLIELKSMYGEPNAKKYDTPLQMGELSELMARVRAWLATLRAIAAIDLAEDMPALQRIASLVPELADGYPRDLLEELGRRLLALGDLKPRLEGSGLTEAFVGRGQRLHTNLQTSIGKTDIDPANLKLNQRRLYQRKAQLYLGLKRCVRAGRVAFMLLPERAAAYHLLEIEPAVVEAPPKAVKPR